MLTISTVGISRNRGPPSPMTRHLVVLFLIVARATVPVLKVPISRGSPSCSVRRRLRACSRSAVVIDSVVNDLKQFHPTNRLDQPAHLRRGGLPSRWHAFSTRHRSRHSNVTTRLALLEQLRWRSHWLANRPLRISFSWSSHFGHASKGGIVLLGAHLMRCPLLLP